MNVNVEGFIRELGFLPASKAGYYQLVQPGRLAEFILTWQATMTALEQTPVYTPTLIGVRHKC